MRDTDHRWTPTWVLDLVRSHEEIGLDPCSSPRAPWHPPHGMWWSLEEGTPEPNLKNGLLMGWDYADHIYINPPYSRGEVGRWVKKAERSAKAHASIGVVPCITMLIPADMSTQASQLAARTCQAIAFMAMRIEFGSPENPSGIGAGAKQPSMLVYWGERAGRFERVMRQATTVWVTGNRVGGAT